MSRIDAAGSLGTMLNALSDKIGANLHVSFPCKVISYDESRRTANVQPLVRTTDDAPAIIEQVPVLSQRLKLLSSGSSEEYIPDYKSGDIVYVAVADNEIKNVLSGSVAKPDTNRQHDRNDCVVLGLFL